MVVVSLPFMELGSTDVAVYTPVRNYKLFYNLQKVKRMYNVNSKCTHQNVKLSRNFLDKLSGFYYAVSWIVLLCW